MPARRTLGSRSYRSALDELRSVESAQHPDEEFVRRIGAVLDELPQLSSRRWELVLAMESVLGAEASANAMAGSPTNVVSQIALENVVRAGARRRVLDEPMLEAEAVARALGSRSVNLSQYANLKRRKGALVGVPVANRYLFPAFQIDSTQGRVVPVVDRTNRLLGAAEDPWGVASWWFSPNGRLGGKRPADLAGDPERSADIEAAARSLLAPLG